MDLRQAAVRFRTAQIADLIPTITAPAIVAGSEASHLGLIPMADPVKSGFGHFICFDQHDANKIVFEHVDFSCDMSVESVSEVSGTGFTDMTINVDVTGTPGLILPRYAAGALQAA